jgi:N-acetylglucosamine kinase-like BadF-type ATPase
MAINEDGDVLHVGHAGPSNILTIPEQNVLSNLALAARGCPGPDRVCGCFAGLLPGPGREQATSLLKTLFPRSTCRAEPDFTAAFYACPEGTDICVIAGTGSLICSLEQNRIVKSGGRGYILGDLGSSQQYGRDALNYFLDVGVDNISDQLCKRIQSVFKTLDPNELISHLYRCHAPMSLLSRLTLAVAKDYVSGEAYAVASVSRNIGSLVQLTHRHFQERLSDLSTIRITLAGGLWKLSDVFAQRFIMEIEQKLKPVHTDVARISRPPVYGAALLAREA